MLLALTLGMRVNPLACASYFPFVPGAKSYVPRAGKSMKKRSWPTQLKAPPRCPMTADTDTMKGNRRSVEGAALRSGRHMDNEFDRGESPPNRHLPTRLLRLLVRFGLLPLLRPRR